MQIVGSVDHLVDREQKAYAVGARHNKNRREKAETVRTSKGLKNSVDGRAAKANARVHNGESAGHLRKKSKYSGTLRK